METMVPSVVVNFMAVVGTLLVMVMAVVTTKGMRAPAAQLMVDLMDNMVDSMVNTVNSIENMEALMPCPCHLDLADTDSSPTFTPCRVLPPPSARKEQRTLIWFGT